MYARGATPEMRTPRALVPAFPAAIPATWVPCIDAPSSNGSRERPYVAPAGVNARATITFAVVNARTPRGKPDGIV